MTGDDAGRVDSIELLSVRVGKPAPLATTTDGDVVWSAIVKQPMTSPTIALGAINLQGDDQADRTVHGGVDKAVYAYSAEHFAAWSLELDQPIGPGAFGENLTITGATESDVAIGDRWQWGDAVVEITQPRWPCFKLTLHRGVRDIGARMKATGRTGWYLRVIQTGTPRLREPSPSSGTIRPTSRSPMRTQLPPTANVTIPRASSASLRSQSSRPSGAACSTFRRRYPAEVPSPTACL